MKKLLLISFAILFSINLNTQAHDFSAVNDGDTIYYKVTSSVSPYTVSVTFKGISYYSNNNYTGNVSIPDSVIFNGNYYKVTSIGNDAFYHCASLTSVIIPNSVTSIGDYSFYNCTSLYSVTIGNSVNSIGNDSFGNTPWFNSMPDGVVYINTILYNYKGIMPANTSIRVEEGTTSIYKCAFSFCTELTSITIPNSVNYVGNSCFYNCKRLKSITIPNSVYEIDHSTFAGCDSLTSITIPNSVTTINDNAFEACGFTSITIPNSVTSIGSNVFKGCDRMTSLIIPNSVTSIDNYVFNNCTALASVTLSNSITSIGCGTFYYCTSLYSIEIPNSVDSIGNYAFSGCSRLNSVIIPNSVTSIGRNAFGHCTELTSITCYATTPPTLDLDVFNLVDKSIPLYVPEASVALYQAAEGWHDFYNIHIGLNDISVANNVDILIYPNPTQDKAKISIDNLSSKADVIVLDIMGKEVKRGAINKGEKVLDIDLSGYAKGIYNIRIVNENINQTKKLIVQ